MSISTVERVRKRFAEQGLEAALRRRATSPRVPTEAGRRAGGAPGRAGLHAAPVGRRRWTLRLLADKLVELRYVDGVSYETVRQVLKKNRLKPWLTKRWCIPPEQSGEFVWRMEDILEVYTRPYDPRRPQVCLDEASKQLLGGARPPAHGEARAARARTTTSTSGTEPPTCSSGREPLRGWRHVEVTERRTKLDWAHVIKDLVDVRYPEAERIVLVHGQPEHPHARPSLYEAFPPAEARRLAEKLEIHYTPKHGSWLNIAEIELSTMSRPVPRPPHPRPRDARTRGRGVGGRAERARRAGQLALHDRGRPHQTEAALPVNRRLTGHYYLVSPDLTSSGGAVVRVTVGRDSRAYTGQREVTVLRSDRRQFLQGSLALAGLGLLAGCGFTPLSALRPSTVPRVGMLLFYSDASALEPQAFLRGMRELGYVEDENIAFEYRFAQEYADLLPALATELVDAHVDLIWTFGTPASVAARQTISTIPSSSWAEGTGRAAGWIQSLGRPGGNFPSGVTVFSTILNRKRLELLKEVAPRTSRVALLLDATSLLRTIVLRRDPNRRRDRWGIEISPLTKPRNPSDPALPPFGAAKVRRRRGLLVSRHHCFDACAPTLPTLPLIEGEPVTLSVNDASRRSRGGLLSYGPNAVWSRPSLGPPT